MRRERRLAQVNEMLRETIGQILIEENSDPILTAMTVTEVRVTADLNYARVYVMCRRPAPGEEEIGTVENLLHAAERVQKLLAPQIHLKRTPKLQFRLDETVEQAERVERLLEQVREDWENADRDSERQ